MTEPDPHWKLPERHEWDWTPDSLITGEYVGYRLYLQLRNRMHQLDVLPALHDPIILHMIDTYDMDDLIKAHDGSACVTMVYRQPGWFQVMDSQELTLRLNDH